MTKHRIRWHEASQRAISFRQMYLLASEIADTHTASHEVRRAASAVVRTLADVIELPVANARLLSKARKKFNKLAMVLDDVEPSVARHGEKEADKGI